MGYCFSLRQVVQFANGQIALIEQQENIDPQAVQHLVFEQVPPQQMVQAVEEATQAQIETKPLPATVAVKQELIQPPVGKVSDQFVDKEGGNPYPVARTPVFCVFPPGKNQIILSSYTSSSHGL